LLSGGANDWMRLYMRFWQSYKDIPSAKYAWICFVLALILHMTVKVIFFESKIGFSFKHIWQNAEQTLHQSPSNSYLAPNVFQDRISESKITILTFWETWCNPCRQEMPLLQTLQNQYPDIVVVGIFESSKQHRVEQFLKKHHIEFDQFHDAERTYLKKYNITAFPTLVVLDADQNILLRQEGFQDTFGLTDPLAKLRKLIDSQLEKTKVLNDHV